MSDSTSDDRLTVVLASYPSRELAESDYEVLRVMEKSGEVTLTDLAVLLKDDTGRVGVLRDLHHPVRKGAVIGAALAVVAPITLVAGAVAGAVGGKLSGLFGSGVGKATLRDLGDFFEANSVILVVMGPPAMAKALGATLTDATRVIEKTLDVTTGAVDEALTD